MKNGKVMPIFKKGKENPGNCRLVSLTPVPRKMLKQILLEAIARQMQDKNVWEQPAQIYQEKQYPTNSAVFYNEMTGSGDKGKTVHVIYLDCCKAYDKCPHSILVARPGRYRLNGWTTKWMKN